MKKIEKVYIEEVRTEDDFSLYFTMDIKGSPKEDELVFYPKYERPLRKYVPGEISNTPFRVIGGTNWTLNIPRPSDSFMEQYRKCKIDVAYIEMEQEFADGITDDGRARRFYGGWRPKLDTNGHLVFTDKKNTLWEVLNDNPHLRQEFDEHIYSAMKHSAYTPTYKLLEWKAENGFVWT